MMALCYFRFAILAVIEISRGRRRHRSMPETTSHRFFEESTE
jgi:hypothetical protein